MIIDTLLQIFLFFIGGFINLLPTHTLNSGMIEDIQGLFESAFAFNSVLPIDTLFLVLTMSLTFAGAVFLWKTINYIISLIRGN